MNREWDMPNTGPVFHAFWATASPRHLLCCFTKHLKKSPYYVNMFDRYRTQFRDYLDVIWTPSFHLVNQSLHCLITTALQYIMLIYRTCTKGCLQVVYVVHQQDNLYVFFSSRSAIVQIGIWSQLLVEENSASFF